MFNFVESLSHVQASKLNPALPFQCFANNWFNKTKEWSIPVQKFPFDHPSVPLGDQFVYEFLHDNSFATFGRDTIQYSLQ